MPPQTPQYGAWAIQVVQINLDFQDFLQDNYNRCDNPDFLIFHPDVIGHPEAQCCL